jgi:thioredoxin reductase (NADPH)
VYAASEGLSTLLLEREAIGGQAGSSSLIRNYLGFPRGVSGTGLASRAFEQAWSFGAVPSMAGPVTGLEPAADGFTLRLAGVGESHARSVLIATGVSYRRLGAPGVDALLGAGVFYGATASEASAFAGEHVFIAGGANSAGQAAVYLARAAKSVTILVRAPSLRKSMSHYLVEQIEKIPNITVRTCTEVAGAHGDGHLEGLTLRDSNTGSTEVVDAGWLFVFIGAAPLTSWLDGIVHRDERGFVLTGPDLAGEGERLAGWPLARAPYHLETSVPGIFVAGDVRAESAKRVASAVGEGAMAVMLVHRYLERT